VSQLWIGYRVAVIKKNTDVSLWRAIKDSFGEYKLGMKYIFKK